MNTQVVTYLQTDKTREALEAWERIKVASTQTWEDWKIVGRFLQENRDRILRETNSKKTTAKRFRDEMGRFLEQTGLKQVDKGERSRILTLLDENKYKLADVEEWINKQPAHRKRLLNHPATILGRYGRYLTQEGKKKNPTLEKKPTPEQRVKEAERQRDDAIQDKEYADEQKEDAIFERDNIAAEAEELRARMEQLVLETLDETVPKKYHKKFIAVLDAKLDELFSTEEDEDVEEDDVKPDYRSNPMF